MNDQLFSCMDVGREMFLVSRANSFFSRQIISHLPGALCFEITRFFSRNGSGTIHCVTRSGNGVGQISV